MKNLTKIFMAVVAGMFAFSCVTDTTEDLGVQLGGAHNGQTTLSISMAEVTKTHLGEKVGELYPLLWSEGDAIAVNGVVSTPLTAEQADANVASFTLDGELQQPYCVVYPAEASRAEGDVTEGEEVVEPEPANTVYPVNFLAEQPYTVGTFAPKAAPMYGYTTEQSMIQMQHLTGVLRLAIKGNGEKVTSILIKVEGGKIAGAFTVDCATGAVVAGEEAVNTVTVTFAEPLVLGDEAQVVYATVPAGSYGTFMVTINTEAHEKMTVKFNSDVKPINAGTVREFGAFTYEANSADTEDGVFEIDSKEALIEFARIASVFYPRTQAKVVATINMAGYDWTPIEGFGAYEFDGGSEEGYSINGLNAPLFGTTAANIKNLNLVDVNIVETEKVIIGAIAEKAYSGTWSNCSASGTMTINNTTFKADEATERDVVNIGGLLGVANGVTLEDCANHIDITIKSISDGTATKTGYFEIGGVVANANHGANLVNADNHGDITLDGTFEGQIDAAGIVAAIVEYSGVNPHVGKLTGCDNHGTISTTKTAVANKQLLMIGLTRQIPSYIQDLSNNHNYGTICHKGTSTTLYMAGLVGVNIWSKMSNCSNNAPIYSDGVSGNIHIAGIYGSNHMAVIDGCNNNLGADLYITENATADGVYIGGIGAGAGNVDSQKASHVISNCNNYASISCAATSGDNGSDDVLLAGIVTESLKTPVTGCRNEGAITFTGTTGDESGDQSHVQIGGITALGTVDKSACVISDCHNTGNLTFNGTAEKIMLGGIIGGGAYTPVTGCTNTGKLEQKANCNKTTNMGGIVSDSIYANVTDCTNDGDIVISGTSGNSYVGGVGTYGLYRGAVVSGCTNNGDIYIAEDATVSRCWLSGIFGHDLNGASADDATQLSTITGCTNTGDIYNAGSGGNTRLGGIVGTVTKGVVENCTNSGAITNKGTARDLLLMGGIVGGAGAITGELTGCTNTGAISNTGTVSSGNKIYAGGLVAYKLFAPMTNCHNEGAITINGTFSGRLYVAGLVANQQDEDGAGYTSSAAVLDNCYNKGAITIGDASVAKTTSSFHVSGLINYSRGRIHDCQNKAEGDILVQNMTIAGTFVCGGLACYTYLTAADSSENKWEENYNYGDITFTNIIGNTAPSIGGLAAYTSLATTSDGATAAALANTNRTSWYNCSNNGTITVTNLATKVSSKKHVRTIIGGCFGTASNIFDYENVDNNGEVSVKIKATSNVFVSGHTGYWGSTETLSNFTAYYKNCDNTKAVTLESVQDATYAGTSSTEGHLVGGIIAQTYMKNGGLGQVHKFENVTNSGAITLKGNAFNDGSYHYAGGIGGYYYTYTLFSNCHNSGVVTVEPTSGTNLKLIRMGGFSGELRTKNSTTTENLTSLTGCTNTAKVHAKGFSTNGSFYIGGLVGHPRSGNNAQYQFDGNSNSGEVSIENVTATGTLYVGGALGYNQVATAECLNTNTNIGNVTISGGSFDSSKTYVGGFVGFTAAPIAGAQAYCDLKALGATNVGMIMGIARADATLASGCGVGGNLIFSQDETPSEIPGQPSEITNVLTPLTVDNYLQYVYGGGSVAASDAEASLLPAKPVLTE